MVVESIVYVHRDLKTLKKRKEGRPCLSVARPERKQLLV